MKHHRRSGPRSRPLFVWILAISTDLNVWILAESRHLNVWILAISRTLYVWILAFLAFNRLIINKKTVPLQPHIKYARKWKDKNTTIDI